MMRFNMTSRRLLGGTGLAAASIAAVTLTTGAGADSAPADARINSFNNLGVLASAGSAHDTADAGPRTAARVAGARADLARELEAAPLRSDLPAAALAARNQEIRTVHITASRQTKVEISTDGGTLCWLADRADGTQISATACWREAIDATHPSRFVTRASDGYRVVVLAPDDVDAVAVEATGGVEERAAVRQNVAVVATGQAVPRHLRWVDESGRSYDVEFDRYDVPEAPVPDGFVPDVAQ